MAQPLDHVIVVLPGIMGSALRDADGDDVWSTRVSAILGGILSRGRSITRLQLPAGIGDDHPGDGVVATELMPDLHVVPGVWSVTIGYRGLRRRLARSFDLVTPADATDDRPANYVEFAYDWRLSNRYNAHLLKRTVEPVLERFRAAGHPDAELVLLAHSMGGLVARYYTDVLGGHEVTAKVITMGTPHRGALNALESLVNGVRKGFGPIGLDLSAFARAMPSLHQLLPEYACLVTGDGLLKTTETDMPGLDSAMTHDAMRFHLELEEGARAHASAFHAHPILGRSQPTATTARIVGGRVETLLTLGAEDQRGDGTVPRLSAAPYGVASDDPILRYVMDNHGHLPGSEVVHVELEGVLTGTSSIPRAPAHEVGVAATDVLLAGEPIDVAVTTEPGLTLDVRLRTVPPSDSGLLAQELGREEIVAGTDGAARTWIADVPPGGYELVVRPVSGSAADTVTVPVAVLAPAGP